MNKVLLIGASGRIGRLLCEKYYDSFDSLVAMVRNMDQSGLPPQINQIEADLESDISSVMEGVDTVIFSAGSGAGTGLDKTLLVDLWGACKAIDAAKHNDVGHFIMVSSRGADDPDRGPRPIKPYLVAKYFADEYLKNSGLCYTILRPGRLTDLQGTGSIDISRPVNPDAQVISREDTARVIAHCVNNPKVRNTIYELYEGESRIEQAIA